MDIILSVFLPLSLAFIMFSLGIGLTGADFARVASQPRAFTIGAVSQIVALPVIAFLVVKAFALSGEIAVGAMILAFCPGGVTSNILTKLAKGDVALSITLTAVISLISILTVPFLVAWAADHFMGLAAPQINVTSLAISMFAITAVPVLLGVAIKHLAPVIAARAEPIVTRVATLLFVIIVICALAANWKIFVDNIFVLGPALVVLNVLLIANGEILARISGLKGAQATAIAIETGTQNATLGITVGSLIVEAASGLPPFSLPSGVYGITMYAVTLPYVWWRRSIM